MVDPLSYFIVQQVLHNWCNKGCDMLCHVYGMVHIKQPLLLIRTGPDGTVVMSSANGLVGTGFASQY